MKKIIFITPPDARYGFSLTGVSQLIAEPGEAEGAVDRTLGDPDCGVLVLDERLLAGLDEERLQQREKRWPGVVVILPAPETGGRVAEDYAERLIRRVIGYQVRLTP